MSSLIISHININSIKSKPKQLELNEYLHSKKIDIMCLNETNLKNTHSLDLKGFNIFRKDQLLKRKGGIAIITRNTLSYEQIDFDTEFPTECIGIKL